MRYLLIAAFAALAIAGCASSPDAPYLAPDPTAAAAAKPAAAKPAARAKATGSLEDARRYMLRGTAAIEMAKSDADLALAEDEFRKATEIAPQMPEAWFNLGAVQVRLGHYNDAIDSYRHYLALAPNAEDAAKLHDDLVKLEFRAEQQARIKSRAGIWLVHSPQNQHTEVGWSNFSKLPVPYRLEVNGDRITLRSVRHDGVSVDVGFFGDHYRRQFIERAFVLEVKGSSLSGTGRRSAFKQDECMIPAEEMEVTGKIDDRSGWISLRYREQNHALDQQVNLLGETVACNSVNVAGTRDVTLVLRGPLPVGGIGAVLNYYEQLKVKQDPHPGFEAAGAGLKEDDAILAVNGVKLSGMASPEIVWLLRGEPGSEVELSVLHEDAKEPVTLRFRRGPLPDRNIGSANLPWLH